MTVNSDTLLNGWVTTTLGNICSNIVGGGTPSTKNKAFWEGDIPWISSADILGLRNIVPRRNINQDAIINSATNKVPKGTIIIVTRVGLGKIGIAPYELCFSQDNQGLIFYSDIVEIDYALQFLYTAVQAFKHSGRGTTISGVTKKQLCELIIHLPSLPEQKQIANIVAAMLSDLDNAIENLKKAQEQLKVYRQALLKYAFDGKLLPRAYEWKYSLLSETCQFNPSKNEIKGLDDNCEVSFLPMPRISENGKILKHEIKAFKDVKKGYTYFRNNDVLLAKITPCFENGKKAVAENLINGVGFGSTEFHVLRPRDGVMPKWILLAVSQEEFRNTAIMQMTGAVGQKRVPQRIVEGYKIPVPSKEDQNKVIQEVESRFSVCDKLEESINENLRKAEALRQSILKHAFEGKLTEKWRKEHKDLISGENSAEALLKKIKAEKEALQVTSKGKNKND